MAEETTFGRYLLNEKLPDEVNVDGPMDKGDLRKKLTDYARKNPDKYTDIIQDVKKFGDEVSTQEGLSVGLDDIQPEYDKRDQIIQEARGRLQDADNIQDKRRILYETEDKVKDITEEHPSDMTLMAKSGGRGSVEQLMKTVSTPVIASNREGKAIPRLVDKSYAEGLDPGDAWVTNEEARRNVFESSGSVVEPGAMAKVVVNTMQDEVVTEQDCGTTNGVEMRVTNEQINDRYPAESNQYVSRDQPITPDIREQLVDSPHQKIKVRSPMTCKSKDGTCQKCMGVDAWGQDYEQGTNVGVRSAQALTEPLTQFVLNAKHGVRLVGDEDEEEKLTGLDGFKVLTEVPKSYSRKAQLAEKSGTVSGVEEAPQGGYNVEIQGDTYYSPPGLEPTVSEGDYVDKGDRLTKGVPMPDEVTKHKGIGQGRKHLADEVEKLYNRQGEDIDRRHAELLAKKSINYVRVEDDPDDEFIPGDVVPYNQIRDKYGKKTRSVDVKDAIGEKLGEEVMHYSVGTLITKQVAHDLKDSGVDEVEIAVKSPEIQPMMKSIERTPLLKDDWQGRLSHRYLKRSLMEGARRGDVSDIRSTDPIPAFVEGKSFGEGPRGKYAQVQEAYNQCRDDGVKVANKLVSKGMDALKTVFKGTDEGIQATKSNPRIVGEYGAVDRTAREAMKLKEKAQKADIDKDLGLFDESGMLKGEEGHQVYKDLEAATPAKNWLSGGKVNTEAAESLRERGVDLTNQELKRLGDERGGSLWRGSAIAGDTLFTRGGLQSLKEKYQKGGIFGKGGVAFGGLAPDPDLRRAYSAMKENPSLGNAGRLAQSGFQDIVFDKGLDYGFPGYMMYQAASEPGLSPSERGEWAGSALGEAATVSALAPTGIVPFMSGYYGATKATESAGKQIGKMFEEDKPVRTSIQKPQSQYAESTPPNTGLSSQPSSRRTPDTQQEPPKGMAEHLSSLSNTRNAILSSTPVSNAYKHYRGTTSRTIDDDLNALQQNVGTLFS